MGVEAKTVVMLCCNAPTEFTDQDDFYDDLDKYSTWEKGSITYIYDGMSVEYFYVGEVLGYSDDTYDSFSIEIDDSLYENSQIVKEFCKDKFNIEQEPKIRVINYIR